MHVCVCVCVLHLWSDLWQQTCWYTEEIYIQIMDLSGKNVLLFPECPNQIKHNIKTETANKAVIYSQKQKKIAPCCTKTLTPAVRYWCEERDLDAEPYANQKPGIRVKAFRRLLWDL